MKEWRVEADEVVMDSQPRSVGGDVEALAVSKEHVVVGVKLQSERRNLVGWRFGEEISGVLTGKVDAPSPISALLFDGHGQRLAAGFADGEVRTWKLKGAVFSETAARDSGRGVRALAFSGDGQVAVGNQAGELVMMDPDDRRRARDRRPLYDHAVMDLAFGASSEILVSVGANDRTLLLRRGDRSIDLEGHTEPVSRLITDMAGRFAVSASVDGTVRVWPLDARGVERLVCLTTGGGLGTADWERYLEGVPRRRLCATMAER